MKKLTVKDFILYNSPCISCGDKPHFEVIARKNQEVGQFLTNKITKNNINITLEITYRTNLNINIYGITGKIHYPEIHKRKLNKFLSDRKIYFRSSCLSCHSFIWSKPITFDTKNDRVNLIEIYEETLLINEYNPKRDIEYLYKIETIDDSSYVRVLNRNQYPGLIFQIECSALPISKMKTKKAFIDKINTYMLFS